MAFDKKKLILYAITDEFANKRFSLCEQVEQALSGGATIIQLRDKTHGENEIIAIAKELIPICHRYGAPLIINDFPLIAVKSGADGVHAGLSDTPVSEIRKMFGRELIVGATAKTVEQAKAAEEQGADYIGVGAVFPSSTKKNAVRITAQQLREITAAVKIPAVAIGGINAQNVLSLKGSGISGIAVVSAVFGAEDIKSAAAELKQTAVEIIRGNSR